MAETLTVVVPTLNEAARLPLLFDALERQTRRPDQIVVADAGSSDETVAVAEARGALVVSGGRPAEGRNAGARVATGDLILFLDADNELDDDLIAGMLDEFEDRGLSVATTFVQPLERTPRNLFATEVVNMYLDAMQYVAPHAPGFCILVRRDVHESIGGFDETVVLAEDHDYVQRAAKLGKFRILRTVSVATSMRRIDKEGLFRLAFKYLYCELYVVTGRPIHEVPFDYEFASFAPQQRTGVREAIATMRESLGALAEAVLDLPAEAQDTLRRLGTLDIAPAAFDTELLGLDAEQVRRVRRYVGARMRLARRSQKRGAEWVRRVGGDIWRELTRLTGE